MKHGQSYMLHVNGEPLVYHMDEITRDLFAIALKREPETLEAQHLIHEQLQVLADRLTVVTPEQAQRAIDEQILLAIADRHVGLCYSRWAHSKVA